MSQRKITILGSTGSIGTQALEVVAEHPEQLSVYALVCHSNIELLAEQAKQFLPTVVVVYDERKHKELKKLLKGLPIEVYAGRAAVIDVAGDPVPEMVLNALVGFAGLEPTIRALKVGTSVAIANKETLVVAGELIRNLCRSSGAMLVPVDSEHSAIFQCLAGEERKQISKLYLTASGGPFVDTPSEDLQTKQPQEALSHPVWSMGAKVTIDSATLMNKGLEMIEAHYLFDVAPKDIEVVVHRQGIVHSMVGFVDGSVKAQLSLPNMKLPIAYALLYPIRYPSSLTLPTISEMATLTFETPRRADFPSLDLAYHAIEIGGSMPCILNAANEVAVERYLQKQVRFTDIPTIVQSTMELCDERGAESYEQLQVVDNKAREIARAWYKK